MTDFKGKLTARGFALYEFKDRNGEACSIQESSLADECAIWLGMKEGTYVDGKCLARMHLNQEIAQELLYYLTVFVRGGCLPHLDDWIPLEGLEPEHGLKVDLWVPGRGRLTNCTWSTAFDPPQWCEPYTHGEGYAAVRKVKGATHFMFVPDKPGGFYGQLDRTEEKGTS